MLTLLTVQFVAEVPISFVSPVLCSETSLSREGMNNKSDPTFYKLLWHCRLFHAPDSLQYQRLTWEHFIKISLHFNSSPLHRKQSLYIYSNAFNWKLSDLEIRVNMNWLAVVIVLQTATKLVGSFDLPKPLDNFYEEVVRFYKRLRTEGGN